MQHNDCHLGRSLLGISYALSVAAATSMLIASAAVAAELLKVYAYGAGTEWVVAADGDLLSKTRVIAQLELDEELGLVRETITPALPGYGPDGVRQEVMTVTEVRRTGADIRWVARGEKDDVRRQVTAMQSAQRLWIYEVWTDRADKVLLYRVRDMSTISARDFTRAMQRREGALNRLSQ